MKDWFNESTGKVNWIVLISWLSMIAGGCYIWYSFFVNGFFITMIWLVVIASVLGISVKLWEGQL